MEHKQRETSGILEVENLQVDIKDKKILKDISLAISKKQFVGILGANGSGKSTLLKAIYQVVKPKSGVILFNEQAVADLSPNQKARQMAVVGQFNATNFDYTVFEYVMMGRYPHKHAFEKMNLDDEAIVIESLSMMGMAAYVSRRVSTLSGGEKQRIVIARALAQQPKCLILDEPTNHLDIKHQLHLYQLLKELKLTTIAVIHDIAFAYNYCDKVYAIKDGLVLAHGNPTDVINARLIKEIYGVKIEILTSVKSNKIAICYL